MKLMKKKTNKIKKWFLAIGIAIVFTMFVNYSIATVFDRPNYQDFCDRSAPKLISTQETCLSEGGYWNERGNIDGFCDTDYTCRQEKNY